MRQLLVRLVKGEEGQDLVEYAFLVAFIALLVTAGVTLVGTNLNTFYTGIANMPGGS